MSLLNKLSGSSPVLWFLGQSRAVRVGLIIVGVLLLVGMATGGWALFDWFNDRQAVQRDRDRANVEALEAELEADRAAGAAADAREEANRQAEEGLNDAIDDAQDDGRNAHDAVADELRRQSENEIRDN